MAAVSVAQVGEFGLIGRLAAVLATPRAKGLRVGIGDDAAAWEPTPGTLTVATTDALVEGVHFDLATTDWHDLGWKALAENVSDIAAMGCYPRYALVALGTRADQDLAALEALYRGLGECGEAYGCAVVGGDIVQAPCVMIQVTVIGESQPAPRDGGEPPLLERCAARPGDTLAVTGPLGGSAAGLRVLRERRGSRTPAYPALAPGAAARAAESETDDVLLLAHRRPQPRVAAGLALIEAGVRCAIDVSDGLVADVGHICERSGVDAAIAAADVPIHPTALRRYGEDAAEMALSGGEDYELVCAAPADVLARATELLRIRGEPPLVPVGTILAQAAAQPSVSLRDADGRLLAVRQRGYQHF